MSDALVISCPAKINLALRVGDVEEDGFHPIRSWMMTIDLFDDLSVTRLDDDAPSEFRINWADDAPRGGVVDWPIEEDLACRAAQVTEHFVGRPLPVAVSLNKRIPTGAGLGGGSSNGASMLNALNTLFDLALSLEHKVALAGLLGSDVPFFFEPTGSALVGGRGEQIEAVGGADPAHLVLITPELHCPTGKVYQRFDELNGGTIRDFEAVDRLAAASLGPDDSFNDLAAPACDLVPELNTIRKRCADVLGRTVHVTGSGAGLFAVADDRAHAESLAAAVREQADEVALAVQAPVPSSS